MTLQIPSPLLEDISRGRATLFLGSGASLEAGLPSSASLSNHLAERAGGAHTSMLAEQPLDSVAEYLYHQPGYGPQWVRDQIQRLFAERMRAVPRPPSPGHALITAFRWRSIFTTNYDRLVEVAYDSAPNAVQSCLPIYASDPQLARHEPDTVNLIKLNGSIDEAARNVAHELVLTFQEQQDRVAKHPQLYELLRNEAVTGPIVFLGFRFVHPGSMTAGTSPEFQQLRELLQMMGPAARWHYCVAPDDQAQPSARLSASILKSARIEVIRSTFGAFLEAVKSQIAAPPRPLNSRSAIAVPIGQTHLVIDAADAEKDARHFQLLHPGLEEDPPTITESLNGGATWSSFFQRHSIERSVKPEFVRRLAEADPAAASILLVSAPAGWGKTFLLRDAAVDLLTARRPTIWLNPHATLEVAAPSGGLQVGGWDSSRLEHILHQIATEAATAGISSAEALPVIIADNCPERFGEVLMLYRALSQARRRFLLVFAVRDTNLLTLQGDHPVLSRAPVFKPSGTYDQASEVDRLAQFCADNHVASFANDRQRMSVVARIANNEAKEGLILALQVIFDREHRPFAQIVRDQWNRLPNAMCRMLVLKVASLHRYGSLFGPRLYSVLRTFPPAERAEVLEAYRLCESEHVLLEQMSENEPCLFLPHSLIAAHIIRVSGVPESDVESLLVDLVEQMHGTPRDLELLRQLAKAISDYSIQMTGEDSYRDLLGAAADSSGNDWVVSQQYAKFLVQRGEFEEALTWTQRAIDANPDHAPLHHTRGNVLRRWGATLRSEGKSAEAERRFEGARQCFAISRAKKEPDEYGYVTHLDMLLHLLRDQHDVAKTTEILAEGVQLYAEGIRAVPEERFNFLLEHRFRQFVLSASQTSDLCKRIEDAVGLGRASSRAAAFLARQRCIGGSIQDALTVIQHQIAASGESVLLRVTEAELCAKESMFREASRSLDTALRNEKDAEDAEVQLRLQYWRLLVSFALDDFAQTRDASEILASSASFRRSSLPRGHFWRFDARGIAANERVFSQHAILFNGRIEEFRAHGTYGRIQIRSGSGDSYNISFNPKYFHRQDLRRNDAIKVVVSILPSGLRADDPSSSPFVNTVDDLFVRR